MNRKRHFFPENTDDYLYFLLGKAASTTGDMKIAKFAFQEACSYGTCFASVKFSADEDMAGDSDHLAEADLGEMGHRFHPYSRKSNRRKSTRTSVKGYMLPTDLKFSGMDTRVGPFLHC